MAHNFLWVLLLTSFSYNGVFADYQSRSYMEGNLDLMFKDNFNITAYKDIGSEYGVPVPNDG